MADSGQGSYNAAVLTKYFDAVAHRRDFWIERNRYFYDADNAYMRFLVPEGARVLEIGCATGQLLAALNPKHGVGLDISPRMIETAKANFPQFEFHVGDAEDALDRFRTIHMALEASTGDYPEWIRQAHSAESTTSLREEYSAHRRAIAQWWYWRGVLEPENRLSSWREAIGRLRSAECNNAAKELTAMLAREI